jgi:Putative transposase
MTAPLRSNGKTYRLEGRDPTKTMTLDAAEFIRRFLIHVLPTGFHRIRHYGLFASGARAHNIAVARRLLAATSKIKTATSMTSTKLHAHAVGSAILTSGLGSASTWLALRPSTQDANLTGTLLADHKREATAAFLGGLGKLPWPPELPPH